MLSSDFNQTMCPGIHCDLHLAGKLYFNTTEFGKNLEASKKSNLSRSLGKSLHIYFLICHKGTTNGYAVSALQNLKEQHHEQEGSLSITGPGVS